MREKHFSIIPAFSLSLAGVLHDVIAEDVVPTADRQSDAVFVVLEYIVRYIGPERLQQGDARIAVVVYMIA